MLRRLALAGALFGPLLMTACDDSTGPQGTAGNIVVRAYVDSDGSGTFTAGDQPISGATVTVTSSDGGATLTQTTDATGVATFTAVRPGSYTAAFSGTVPDGAVLGSASNPVVVLPFRGGEVNSEFRYVLNPGSISGRLYRDNNGNGIFEPNIDTPAAGLDVALFRGGEAVGEPIAITTTGADGSFSFTTLRPGQYTVDLTPFPTIQIVDGATRTVTVGAASTFELPLQFTGSLLSTIAEVRAGPVDQTVAFEGVVTAAPGIFSTSTAGNQFNVQDRTGGILILDTPLSLGIEQGDSVRVVGRTVLSSGEFLIRGPTITKLGTGTLPAPRLLTAEQIASSTADDPLQGSLVQVGNVCVTAVSGTATSSSYNVTVGDDAGNSFVIRVGSANVGLPQTFWETGRCYDVVGLLASFNGPQLKVRSADDVALRSSATPIGVVRANAFADSAGTRFMEVTVEGVVHTGQGTFRSDNAFIQDPTGGMLLFGLPGSLGLEVGDSIRVTGRLDWFNGELEIVNFSSTQPMTVERLGTGATPLPVNISGAQFNARSFEGMLIRTANVEVLTVSSPSSSGAYTVTARAPDGDTIAIRIENSSIGITASSWTVGQRYTVIGALSTFRGTAQVKPRSAADVTAGSANVITIAAAEQRADGDTVTVEGVVTAPVGPFGTANAYIDDGTAGIQIFGVPTTVALKIGDVIRVTGLAGEFSQERQITRFSSSSLLQIEHLGTAPAPQPRTVTGAQVAARTFEGELVQLDGVVVESVGSVSSAGGYNVNLRAADGTEVVLRNDRAAVGIPVDFWVVGGTYDVAGILSAFNGAPQLKPRGTFDVVRR